MGVFQDLVTQNRWKRALIDRSSAHRRDVTKSYHQALELERAPAAHIEAVQTARLRALLERACEAPYFRETFEKNQIRPREFESKDLTRIPFLTKEILRSEGGRLRIPHARSVHENYSGGSTGIPVRFWQDYHYKVHMSVATRRSNEMAGAFPGARVAKLWGAPQDKRRIEGLFGRAKLWLLNQRYYDSFDMGAERMELYHRSLETFQPDIIQAYASSIHLFAKFLRSRGIRPNYPSVSIISAAERLDPRMRQEIEEVFPVRVFDRYGSREISAMAAECEEHDGLHIQMPSYIVETIDPWTGASIEDRPGEIVITVLNNFAMPFLRYRIGDMGVLTRAACPCGSSFPRLQEVIGRTSDNFLMADGRIVHGERFTHLFYGRDSIEQFQFEQDAIDTFTLRLVPARHYSPEAGDLIEREIRSIIGESAELSMEIRERIPKTESGKYRYTISNVSLDQAIGSPR